MADPGDSYPQQAIGGPRIIEGDITWDISTDVSKNLAVPQKIHRLDRATAGAPILGFSTRIGGPRTVNNWMFYMLRTRRFRDYIQCTGTATAAKTDKDLTFAAADMDLLLPGFRLVNLNTREMLEMDSKSGTTGQFTRAVGTVAVAAISASDTFMILGYSGSEGDSKFFGLSKSPEAIFNHVGELQDSFSITQWEMAGSKLPGAETPQAKERVDHLENMRINYEKRALFDQRSKATRTTDGKTVWTPNGLDSWCTENELDMSGDITEAKLLQWAEDLSRFSTSGSITIMCSPKFLRKVNIALSGRMRNNSDVLKRAGLNVSSYDAGGLVMNFFRHPLFYDDPTASTVTDALSGHAYAVPFDDFKPVTIKSKMTGWFRWNMNVQTPGDRKIQDQLYTNYGFMMVQAERYGRAYNVGS